MERKSHGIVVAAILAALVAAPAAGAGNGRGNPTPAPLAPDQALPLINGPVTTGASSVRSVSPQDALAAGAAAGATTSTAPGYTSPGAAVAASTGCASVTSWVTWGTWPYERTLYENTYWCAVYASHITYWSTTVTTSQTLCRPEGTASFAVSGGIGYSWVEVQANANWSCPIVGVIPYGVGGWIRTSYNAWGNAAVTGHS